MATLITSNFNGYNYDYSNITNHGDKIKLSLKVDIKQLNDIIDLFCDRFHKYNPRKDINRYGLSLKNLTGSLDEMIDLDSLPEYNKENGTDYKEDDFDTSTIAFEQVLDSIERLEDIDEHIYRAHILKLGSGGFFPWHRDSVRPNTETMRLIMPLRNCDTPNVYFIYEDKILDWDKNLYFLNTHKYHTLFNASMEDSYWLILNVRVCDETIDFVIRNG